MFSLSSSTAHSVSSNRAKAPLGKRILAALAVWRSRQQLASLDAHRLDDLGISENAAKSEANRPIWDVPAHWIK